MDTAPMGDDGVYPVYYRSYFNPNVIVILFLLAIVGTGLCAEYMSWQYAAAYALIQGGVTVFYLFTHVRDIRRKWDSNRESWAAAGEGLARRIGDDGLDIPAYASEVIASGDGYVIEAILLIFKESHGPADWGVFIESLQSSDREGKYSAMLGHYAAA